MKKISVVLPVLAPTPAAIAMTEFCIRTMRAHADNPFELVVVEAENSHFHPSLQEGEAGKPGSPLKYACPEDCRPDVYRRFQPKIGGVREINAGIRAASGEFIVTTGNDVIVPPHWDTELLLPFERFKDCGLSSLSAKEPGAFIGPEFPLDLIVEGMYSPFNMFRKGWEYDESFFRIYQDSDLVMRMYAKGLRAYRSCRAAVHHLLRMTNDNYQQEEHNVHLVKDEKLFYSRWNAKTAPWMMFGLIRSGGWRFGQEHVALLGKVNSASGAA